MGARHHSTNERNGKWTMRRAYFDENRHCAMWLTCKGMPVQHGTGISIRMMPRTWSPTIRSATNIWNRIESASLSGYRTTISEILRSGVLLPIQKKFLPAEKIIFSFKSYIYSFIFMLLDIRYLWFYKIIDGLKNIYFLRLFINKNY